MGTHTNRGQVDDGAVPHALPQEDKDQDKRPIGWLVIKINTVFAQQGFVNQSGLIAQKGIDNIRDNDNGNQLGQRQAFLDLPET